jgi:hypothetical protein
MAGALKSHQKKLKEQFSRYFCQSFNNTDIYAFNTS